MSQKQNPVDLGLFAAGIGLIIGSFSPWISVAIMNLSGTDGWRGYVTLVSGLILVVNASTRLWPQILDKRFTSKLSLLSKVSLVASLAVLVEVGVRLRQVTNEISDIASESGSTPTDTTFSGLTQAFDDLAKSLTDALKPQLAIGWYVCLLSVAVTSALIFTNRAVTEDVDVAS
jgi:hypothetical protein